MTSPDSRFQAELSNVFGATWQFAGLDQDLRRRGDYIAQRIAGVSVVVVKTDDGLKAYLNVCPHRAGPFVSDEKGRCKAGFICRAHQWRFTLDGALESAPDYDALPGFSAEGLALTEIDVDVWRGLIFVRIHKGSGSALVDQMAAVHDHALFPSDRPARIDDVHQVACDWKLYARTYLNSSPITGKFDQHGPVAHYVGPPGEGRGRVHWIYIWPNLALTLFQGVLQVEVIRPLAPDMTEIRHHFLHLPEDPSVEAAIVDSEHATHLRTQICEAMQANMASGHFRPTPYFDEIEASVAWFDRQLARVATRPPGE